MPYFRIAWLVCVFERLFTGFKVALMVTAIRPTELDDLKELISPLNVSMKSKVKFYGILLMEHIEVITD